MIVIVKLGWIGRAVGFNELVCLGGLSLGWAWVWFYVGWVFIFGALLGGGGLGWFRLSWRIFGGICVGLGVWWGFSHLSYIS